VAPLHLLPDIVQVEEPYRGAKSMLHSRFLKVVSAIGSYYRRGERGWKREQGDRCIMLRTEEKGYRQPLSAGWRHDNAMNRGPQIAIRGKLQKFAYVDDKTEWPRCHRGCSIFDEGVAASADCDTPRLGRTFTRTPFRPLHCRKRPAPAFISQTRSLARLFQDTSTAAAILASHTTAASY
jgi:hypothetical protein